jgi:uncharacterized protein YecE (DUF72 family)
MIRVGTSGYNYPEWRGRFYPDDLPASRMLPYYASQFATVEINYTFYRMPTEKVLSGWAAKVPETFTFALKAPRRITHDSRLRDCADAVHAFCRVATTLGSRLGPLLFQLPPSLRCDLTVFDAFLDMLPPRTPATFEFRHASWFDEAVFERLRARNFALCIADSDERHTPVVVTADFGYARLRDEGYAPGDIARWATTLAGESRWRDTHVYFKHEDEGKGPEFARTFIASLTTGS